MEGGVELLLRHGRTAEVQWSMPTLYSWLQAESSHYDPRLSALYLKAVGESDITVRIKVENDGF